MLSIVRYSFLQLSELGHLRENENAQVSQKGFEPGLSRLRVRHSMNGKIIPDFIGNGY